MCYGKLEVGSHLLVKFLGCYPKIQVKSNKQFSALAWNCDFRLSLVIYRAIFLSVVLTQTRKRYADFFLDGSSKFFSFTNGMPRNLDSGPLGYLICDTYLTGFKYQS